MKPRHFQRRMAFTIIEVMIALALFGMILTAIYATWMAILKGSRIGLQVAAEVQRSRIAVRALEEAFLTVQMFVANGKHYPFVAVTSGDFADISMTARLPTSFPGIGRYGDVVVRRVNFYVRPGGKNGNELVMVQYPFLLDTNTVPAYSLVLAQDVSLFALSFYDAQKNEWLEDWKNTNQLPRLVQIALGLGKVGNSASGKPHDLVTRLVNIPSTAVAGDIQGFGPQPGQQQPGRTNRQNQPNPNDPNNPNNPNNPFNPNVPFNPNNPNQNRNPVVRPPNTPIFPR